MTVPYTCNSLLIVRRVSSSYTEKIGCIQSVNTQETSIGRNHIRFRFWLTMNCMSSCTTIISFLFASH